MSNSTLPNWWDHPEGDPKFQGLLEISWTISDAHDMALGSQELLEESEVNPEFYHFWTPLRLAQTMEQAAQRIREWTEDPPQ